MLTKFSTIENDREQGFTLIELLVVILIIGILAAIAIPAFLNQRKAAVDSSVQSDLGNISINVETLLINYPDAGSITTDQTGRDLTITASKTAATKATDPNRKSITMKLSEGVVITMSGTEVYSTNGYVIKGTHTGGDIAKAGFYYKSNQGGISTTA